MSADLIDVDNSHTGSSITLTMRANGYVELTILEPDYYERDGPIASFGMKPTQKDMEKALAIAEGLKNWVDHVKLVGLEVNEEGK